MVRNEIGKDDDREANLFAMELLMPESFIRNEIAKLSENHIQGGFDATIKHLANRFQVDQSVMMLRLGQLGFICTAIALPASKA